MQSDSYNRYIWLIQKLVQYRELSYQEIADMWDRDKSGDCDPLNKRTFHQHKKVIADTFHIYIECYKADVYKYYISNKDNIYNDKSNMWMIRTFGINHMLEKSRDIKERIILEDVPRGTEFLSGIVEGMRNNHVLILEYRSYYSDFPSVYHLSPYCLRVKHQRWYLLGWIEEKNALWHVALDRINDVKITNEHFVLPKDFLAESYYADSIGVYVDKSLPIERVTIRAYGKSADYISSLPLHRTQRKVEVTIEYTDFEYHINVTPDLIGELLKFGSGIEVVEPESLRTKIRAEISSIIKRYE